MTNIMNNQQEKFDVVVIGGGPAGMMVAGRAAELGAKVVLLEKNRNPGRKLLITGKGRCNITQAKYDDRKFVEALGENGHFLFSALTVFGPTEVIKFFEERGLRLKTERGGRVFPVTDRAQDVLDVLSKYLKENKVKIISSEEVLGFEAKGNKIAGIRLRNRRIQAKFFILCTGGKSYPITGSTGDGYGWAKALGHKIIETRPALVSIRIKEGWAKEITGLSLKNVRVNVFQNGKKQATEFGEMLFAHFGLSGPIILDVSKKIGELLAGGEVQIEIDLKPALDFSQLDKRLQRDFEKNIHKDFKNYLPELLPKKMIEIVIALSSIDPRKKLNFITSEERRELVKLLKGIKLTVGGLMDYNQAVITTGGVDLKEIDSKTMRSKLIDNLFFAGEIINLDGPTGGYNLQICWSTGYVAGSAIARLAVR